MGCTPQCPVTCGVMFFLLLSVSAAADSPGDTEPTSTPETNSTTNPTMNPNSNYSKVSCDFSDDSCGWENVGGENYPRTWTRKGDYMHLDMGGADNEKGRLASPWLHPLENYRCKLRFRYYIRNLKGKNCQLSLLRQTTSDEESVWSTRDSTGWSDFSGPIYQDINCTAGRFRIVFEGWKSCRVIAYNEIDVKAIEFSVYPSDEAPPTESTRSEAHGATIELTYTGTPDSQLPDDTGATTGVTIPSPPQTGVTGSDKDASTEPLVKERNRKSSSAGLDSGSWAGIVIAIIVVVVVVVIVVIFVVRRRRNKSDKDLARRNVSSAMPNSAYMPPDALQTGGSDGVNGGNRAEAETGYELGDLQQPYNTPAATNDDTSYRHLHLKSKPAPSFADHTNGARFQPPTNLNDDNYNQLHLRSKPMAAATPSEDTYDHTTDTYDHTTDTYDHTTDTYDHTTDTYDHTKSTQGHTTDTYDHTTDTYDHTSCHQHPQPSTDDNAEPHAYPTGKQHAPKIEDPTTPSEASANDLGAEVTNYEIVDDVGRVVTSSEGDDVYSHLDSAEEKKGEQTVSENVYDHAREDNYDNLHLESRKRKQQRQLAEEEYSHI